MSATQGTASAATTATQPAATKRPNRGAPRIPTWMKRFRDHPERIPEAITQLQDQVMRDNHGWREYVLALRRSFVRPEDRENPFPPAPEFDAILKLVSRMKSATQFKDRLLSKADDPSRRLVSQCTALAAFFEQQANAAHAQALATLKDMLANPQPARTPKVYTTKGGPVTRRPAPAPTRTAARPDNNGWGKDFSGSHPQEQVIKPTDLAAPAHRRRPQAAAAKPATTGGKKNGKSKTKTKDQK